MMFQFPTGWNSTLLARVFLFPSYVSIPNGMEFYVPRLNLTFAHSKGFNSQRDGILLKEQELIVRILWFQFPTGWNSTPFARFILARTPVSIPNGMEFYALCPLFLRYVAEVSIPNGMEFYAYFDIIA